MKGCRSFQLCMFCCGKGYDFSFCLNSMSSVLESFDLRMMTKSVTEKGVGGSMILGWWDELNSTGRSCVAGKKHFYIICKTTSVLALES